MTRVVVTGLGVVSALGNNADDFWQALAEGRPGIGPLTTIPTENLLVRIGAEVRDFDLAKHFDPKKVALFDRFTQMALVAAREAIADAGIAFEPEVAARTATIIGSGAGGQATMDDAYWRIYAEGAKRIHPLTIPRIMINAAPSQITMEHGLTGPAFTVASACSSANHAIGVAFHMVRGGAAEVAVTGGADACISVGMVKGWEAIRVLANDTCRPFSKGRTGMVLGEGSAIMILETLERAQARGAPIYAEIAGFGMSSDAWDITQPSVEGGVRAIEAALADGGLAPEEIDYVNAHGTGTTANDVSETESLHRVFGDHAKKLMVSSTKSMHGHALGAAGALELAATLLAIRHQIAPPTINYVEPDPKCDLDYVPNEAREARIGAAISNSFAFGGLNAILAVRRLDG